MLEQSIFKKGSTTYYWSAKFFPGKVRGDVYKLYSFVRVADDYVDSIPQQKAKFKALRRAWQAAIADPHFATTHSPADSIDERVVKNMVYVHKKYAFDLAWVEAFLNAMQADIEDTQYQTLEDTLAYVHGSAEVIGLMMAKIMNLSPAAYETAMLQGRAMQYINFIRDIYEDGTRGRCYFPQEDLQACGLTDLAPETVRANKAGFKKFIAMQLNRYKQWQTQANEGFKHIPRRPRIAIKTAVDMYNWTGREIGRRPVIVFERKVRPAPHHVLRTGVKNLFSA